MATGFYNVPKAVNEPAKAYAPNSPERKELLAMYKKMYNDKFCGSSSFKIKSLILYPEID